MKKEIINKKILIIGLGWLGLPLALNLEKNGHLIFGTTTNQSKEEKIRSRYGLNVTTFLLPNIFYTQNTGTRQFPTLSDFDVIVFNVPPQNHKYNSKNSIEECLSWIKYICGFNGKLVFISSTSVYGKNRGLVDELSPISPETIGANELGTLEKYIENNYSHYTIIRPGGLYGGSRHPIKSLQGKENLTNGEDHLHLIDRESLIDLTTLTIETSTPKIINAVLPYDKNKKYYYEFMAKKFNLKKPNYQEGGHLINTTQINPELFQQVFGRALPSPENFEFSEELLT